MMGVFVQLNEGSIKARHNPIGYVIQENGCWEWVGPRRNGYGRFRINGRLVTAHRHLFESTRGPVPVGLELDHLCRNRACVNPDHLEPVTGQTNQQRGNSAWGINARKGHCPRGHPLIDGNLVVYDKARGRRRCLACERERAKRRGRARHARLRDDPEYRRRNRERAARQRARIHHTMNREQANG